MFSPEAIQLSVIKAAAAEQPLAEEHIFQR
jgi:hypothetical protein